MTRRYGRNQKRRAREQIEQLEQSNRAQTMQLHQAQDVFRTVSLHATKLERILEQAKRVLGKQHPLFAPEPIEVRLGSVEERRFRMAGQGYDALETPILRAKMRTDDLQLQRHALVTWDDMAWGYAFSERAFAGLTVHEAARLLADRIAPLIAKALDERNGGRRRS